MDYDEQDIGSVGLEEKEGDLNVHSVEKKVHKNVNYSNDFSILEESNIQEKNIKKEE